MKLQGVIVPLVTPFDAGKRIDTAKLAALADEFVARGVGGIVACGTTGEYYSFTEEERETVLRVVAEAVKGRCTLIAGIGSLSTEMSAHYAKQAQGLGYEGLMLSPPPYSLPSQQGIIAHFEYVAAATDLPIVMYNFPARIGVEIEFDTVAHLAKHPKIAAIKESSGNFSNALRMIQAKWPDFEVVCGCDDQPVDFFFWGVTSWISGSANVFPDEQVALFEAAQSGDWAKAKRIFEKMYPALLSMESEAYNQKAKAGCLQASRPAGGVRLPLHNLSEAQIAEFTDLVKQGAGV